MVRRVNRQHPVSEDVQKEDDRLGLKMNFCLFRPVSYQKTRSQILGLYEGGIVASLDRDKTREQMEGSEETAPHKVMRVEIVFGLDNQLQDLLGEGKVPEAHEQRETSVSVEGIHHVL